MDNKKEYDMSEKNTTLGEAFENITSKPITNTKYIKTCIENNIIKIYTVDNQHGQLLLYDANETNISNFELTFPIYYKNNQYVTAHILFSKKINPKKINNCKHIASTLYLLESRNQYYDKFHQAKLTDTQTGLPNIVAISRKYNKITKLFG